MPLIPETKIVHSGNKAAAQGHIKFATAQLAILERLMSYQKLNEGRRVVSPYPGVTVECTSRFGHKEVHINVASPPSPPLVAPVSIKPDLCQKVIEEYKPDEFLIFAKCGEEIKQASLPSLERCVFDFSETTLKVLSRPDSSLATDTQFSQLRYSYNDEVTGEKTLASIIHYDNSFEVLGEYDIGENGIPSLVIPSLGDTVGTASLNVITKKLYTAKAILARPADMRIEFKKKEIYTPDPPDGNPATWEDVTSVIEDINTTLSVETVDVLGFCIDEDGLFGTIKGEVYELDGNAVACVCSGNSCGALSPWEGAHTPESSIYHEYGSYSSMIGAKHYDQKRIQIAAGNYRHIYKKYSIDAGEYVVGDRNIGRVISQYDTSASSIFASVTTDEYLNKDLIRVYGWNHVVSYVNISLSHSYLIDSRNREYTVDFVGTDVTHSEGSLKQEDITDGQGVLNTLAELSKKVSHNNVICYTDIIGYAKTTQGTYSAGASDDPTPNTESKYYDYECDPFPFTKPPTSDVSDIVNGVVTESVGTIGSLDTNITLTTAPNQKSLKYPFAIDGIHEIKRSFTSHDQKNNITFHGVKYSTVIDLSSPVDPVDHWKITVSTPLSPLNFDITEQVKLAFRDPSITITALIDKFFMDNFEMIYFYAPETEAKTTIETCI
jgi:hypothetical protein